MRPEEPLWFPSAARHVASGNSSGVRWVLFAGAKPGLSWYEVASGARQLFRYCATNADPFVPELGLAAVGTTATLVSAVLPKTVDHMTVSFPGGRVEVDPVGSFDPTTRLFVAVVPVAACRSNCSSSVQVRLTGYRIGPSSLTFHRAVSLSGFRLPVNTRVS